jgi:uncharacterized repeat protein (TIGR03803 family)
MQLLVHADGQMELFYQNTFARDENKNMPCTSRPGRGVRSSGVALLLFFCAIKSYSFDTYNPGNRQLTIPTLSIGNVTYSTVVVTLGEIVSGPSGGASNGSIDSYNPANQQLTVQSVSVNSTIYHNVLITVGQLVSIGGVAGSDFYTGAELIIPSVQVLGGALYSNVSITVSNIVTVKGGMPLSAVDQYNPVTHMLTIPAVQFDGNVYTNVIVTVEALISACGLPLKESDLYSFSESGKTDGSTPYFGSMIQGKDGNFYGTTIYGGQYSAGTVFKVTPGGLESVVYAFTGGPSGLDGSGMPGSTDGWAPQGGLIQGKDGNFYGTTSSGGGENGDGGGIVFMLTPSGEETVLHRFPDVVATTSDGSNPYAGVIQGSDGNFYGTTYNGGAFNSSGNGRGTVFMVTPEGVETVLHSFSGNGAVEGSTDGAYPNSTLIQASDGNFYGTTNSGGATMGFAGGDGAVFKITPTGIESVLYSFGAPLFSNPDGIAPIAGVIQAADGNFYGTTSNGGANSVGTVYMVTPAGVESVLYSFTGSRSGNPSTDGSYPFGGLILGTDGNFYGTTEVGGLYNEGIVYKFTGGGSETVLYSFTGNDGISGSKDGSEPWAGLLQGSDGNLYGTTRIGGAFGGGVVFRITNVITGP